jgi:hypothetical protein
MPDRLTDERRFRLMVGHEAQPTLFHETNRTFCGRTKAEAERKAEKFFIDGQFHHMGWYLLEEDDHAE